MVEAFEEPCGGHRGWFLQGLEGRIDRAQHGLGMAPFRSISVRRASSAPR